MFTTITRRRSRLATAALGVVAAVSLAFAPAASAAAGQTSSFGVLCRGLVNCGPFAASAFPGGPPTNTLARVTVTGLVTTGVLNTTANKGGATASVADVSAVLSGISTLTATAVSSQCTVNSTTGAISGSSSIANGSITALGTPITLAATPGVNSRVTFLDPAIASITLNRQVRAADGTLTVDAIFITLLNSQTIVIARSVCGPPALGIPVIAPAFAVGTVGAAAVGLPVLGFFLYRRRPTSADIARA